MSHEQKIDVMHLGAPEQVGLSRVQILDASADLFIPHLRSIYNKNQKSTPKQPRYAEEREARQAAVAEGDAILDQNISRIQASQDAHSLADSADDLKTYFQTYSVDKSLGEAS